MATKSAFPVKVKKQNSGVFKQHSDGPAVEHKDTLSYATTVKQLSPANHGRTKTLKR